MRETKLKGIYENKGRLYTKNFTPKKTVYGEKTVIDAGVEYREWDPTRSKLAAAIRKGATQIGIMPGKTVLYLGSSTGSTPSHVSDIIGKEGFEFALDFAPRVVRELYFLCKHRENMAPLLEDAKHPENYKDKIVPVDTIFQDIAQQNQVEIFLKNLDMHLKNGGYGVLALKARSIDVTRNPRQIFKEVRRQLEEKVIIVDYRELEPFERDHCFFVVKKK